MRMQAKDKSMGVNPFVQALQLKATTFKADGYVGEESGIRYPKRYMRDQTPSTKVFDTSMLRKTTMGLSGTSLKIYLWFIFKATSEHDYIKLNRLAFMKEAGITSKTTVNTGLDALIRYEIIAKSNLKDVYWFNPLYFFRGDRLKKYRYNVEIVNEVGAL